jgi:hypothetical protein
MFFLLPSIRMSACVKMQTRKYAFRNSPPYPANQCKSMKKRGNDGMMYVSQPDKNGVYKWAPVTKTLKNKATKATSKEIQMLAKKYMVSPSGSTKELAHRLVELRGASITNKKDKHIIEQFLTHSTPSTKRWGFVPA